jgi:DNA-binding PadR family transcriptional regulator
MNPASNLEYAILGLLRQTPQSGYDLRKTFMNTAMRHYSDSPGSIYPALRRLQARGWIAADSPSAPNDRRGRQVFRPAPDGTAALNEWLSRNLSHDDVVLRLQELMLRFAFMDGNVPRSTAIRFLEQFERELGNYFEELRGQYEQMRSSYPINTGLLAFQSGIEGFEAQLSWARRARLQLAEGSS